MLGSHNTLASASCAAATSSLACAAAMINGRAEDNRKRRRQIDRQRLVLRAHLERGHRHGARGRVGDARPLKPLARGRQTTLGPASSRPVGGGDTRPLVPTRLPAPGARNRLPRGTAAQPAQEEPRARLCPLLICKRRLRIVTRRKGRAAAPGQRRGTGRGTNEEVWLAGEG